MGKEMNKAPRPFYRKRQGGLAHIGEVIDALFASPHYPIDFEDMKLWRLWDGIVGKKVAKHARPASIKKGVLVVKVSDSVWLQELEFRAHEIKELVNRALQREAIQGIRFRVGEPKAKPSKE